MRRRPPPLVCARYLASPCQSPSFFEGHARLLSQRLRQCAPGHLARPEVGGWVGGMQAMRRREGAPRATLPARLPAAAARRRRSTTKKRALRESAVHGSRARLAKLKQQGGEREQAAAAVACTVGCRRAAPPCRPAALTLQSGRVCGCVPPRRNRVHAQRTLFWASVSCPVASQASMHGGRRRCRRASLCLLPPSTRLPRLSTSWQLDGVCTT